jgi:hypothetical protein
MEICREPNDPLKANGNLDATLGIREAAVAAAQQIESFNGTESGTGFSPTLFCFSNWL